MKADKPVSFQVNGEPCQGMHEESLLDAIERAGHRVPHLCHHPGIKPYGACRLCLVEVQKGRKRRLVTSCDHPVLEGLSVFLDTASVIRHRRVVLELLLAMAPASTRIRALAQAHNIRQTRFEARASTSNCILCGLCARVCREVVGANAITMSHRGARKELQTKPFAEFPDSCIGCGACAHVCPTDAISMEDQVVKRLRGRWGERRPCRYALMGLCPGTVCENDYQCFRCEVDQQMVDRASPQHPVFLARAVLGAVPCGARGLRTEPPATPEAP